MEVKVIVDPLNGNRHYVIDEENKIKTLISDEAVKDCSSYQTDDEGVLHFYIEHLQIAQKNKSQEKVDGYYQSHIYQHDVCPDEM
jgi:hypothetical protein